MRGLGVCLNGCELPIDLSADPEKSIGKGVAFMVESHSSEFGQYETESTEYVKPNSLAMIPAYKFRHADSICYNKSNVSISLCKM